MNFEKIKQFIKKYKIVVLVVFLIDIIIPDFIPFFDEIILGIASIYGFM